MKLNLGCGDRKVKDYINIDINEDLRPDMVVDIGLNGLPFVYGEVDEIRAFDFLEHIHPDKVIFVINEIWRVLKPGGVFEHFTPSTDGRGAFQDPTHRSFWNINSWLYFTTPAGKNYGIDAQFEIIQIRDIISGNELRIIHTHGVFRKPELKKNEQKS